ncbi:hypothetical protein HED51_01965 [Ochrobactrum grignonense]|nr:hypothetical protein [Brucella grignonensis]
MTPDDINAEASPANMPTPMMVPLNFINALSCSGYSGFAVRGADKVAFTPTWDFECSGRAHRIRGYRKAA